MENGWIKIYRKLLDNPFCKNNCEHTGFWLMLLLKANHSLNYEFYFNNQKIILQPGQFITGRKALALSSNISESCCEQWLSCLENEQQIEQQKTNKYRLITIQNWEQYQQNEQQNEQQKDNRKTTERQQKDTYKNDKNDKNTNMSISFDFEALWKLYPRPIGKKMALKHFNSSVKNEQDYQNIKKALTNYLQSKTVLADDEQYIQHGSTWFNNWQDWIEPKNKIVDDCKTL